MKRKLIALILVLILVLPGAASASYTDSLINLLLRYNAFVTDHLPLIESVDAPETGTKADTYNIKLNKYGSMLVSTAPGTLSLNNIMVFVSGDGSALSGLEVMQTLSACCGAMGFINTMDQSYKFMEKVGLFGDGALDGRQNKYSVDGYEIAFSNSKVFGLMMTITKP